MPLKSIRAWLGVDTHEDHEFAPLRDTLEALDHLEPERARYLSAFAYLLGRVAYADQHVSPDETAAMEALVRKHGQLSPDQAMVVVQLAKTSNLLFGGTADFLVAKEFSQRATNDQKLALLACLFALAATDESISVTEESEIHRIATELRIEHPDLIALRVAHRRHLPGIVAELCTAMTPLRSDDTVPILANLMISTRSWFRRRGDLLARLEPRLPRDDHAAAEPFLRGFEAFAVHASLDCRRGAALTMQLVKGLLV